VSGGIVNGAGFIGATPLCGLVPNRRTNSELSPYWVTPSGEQEHPQRTIRPGRGDGNNIAFGAASCTLNIHES